MDQQLKELSDRKGDDRLYQFLHQIESSFRARMETKGKPIYPNVDFVSGSVYDARNSALFVHSDIRGRPRAGWLAHTEQRENNRLYRPDPCMSARKRDRLSPSTNGERTKNEEWCFADQFLDRRGCGLTCSPGTGKLWP